MVIVGRGGAARADGGFSPHHLGVTDGQKPHISVLRPTQHVISNEAMVLEGEITEIVGRLSSGRSSLLAACVRDVTHRGAVVALVDTDHAFDPASAARAGVDLRRVLWVRCGGRRDVALRAADLLLRCPGFALVALDLGETPPRLPLTRAFRLRLAARRTGTALVILASRRVAGAAAALAVETSRRGVRWAGPGRVPTRLARVASEVRVLRRRGDIEPGDGARGSSTLRWWAA
jgi:hypothetical protein